MSQHLIANTLLYLAISASISYAADDALSRLRAAAAQGKQQIEEIATRPEVTVADLNTLAQFIHESGNLYAEVSGDALVAPARKIFAKIANQNPHLLSEYIAANLANLRAYPHIIADLIFAAMNGAPQIIQSLATQNLISSEVVNRALERNTGMYPINTGFAGSGRADMNIISANLDAQLPDKIQIAIALFDAGLRSERINEILIEGVELKSLVTGLKIRAIERLRISGTTTDRAVAALKSVVIPPIIMIAATVRDMDTLRPTAVSAIGSIPTQASVDALWDISGLDTTSTPTSRPLRDTTTVISMAKEARQNLMRQGNFRNRSLTERATRAVRCALLLIVAK